MSDVIYVVLYTETDGSERIASLHYSLSQAQRRVDSIEARGFKARYQRWGVSM